MGNAFYRVAYMDVAPLVMDYALEEGYGVLAVVGQPTASLLRRLTGPRSRRLLREPSRLPHLAQVDKALGSFPNDRVHARGHKSDPLIVTRTAVPKHIPIKVAWFAPGPSPKTRLQHLQILGGYAAGNRLIAVSS